MRLAADFAEKAGDDGLLDLLKGTARRWYGRDEACPAWGEPSGDDFLSSALIEAECMRRLMPAKDFLPWFERFLPQIADGVPATLFHPATVSDRSDGKIAHLDGLSLSRAWCWRSLARTLPETDIRAVLMESAAERHLAVALPHVAGDYMGEHWWPASRCWRSTSTPAAPDRQACIRAPFVTRRQSSCRHKRQSRAAECRPVLADPDFSSLNHCSVTKTSSIRNRPDT